MTIASLSAVQTTYSRGQWIDPVSDWLDRNHFTSDHHRSSLVCWRPDALRRLSTGGSFANGYTFRSLWLGGGITNLSILPKRIYLHADGSRDTRPEREIVGSQQKPTSPIAARLTDLKAIANDLQQDCKEVTNSVTLTDLDLGLANHVVRITRRREFLSTEKLRRVHEQGWFLRVPNDFQICICGDDDVSSSVLTDFVEIAKSEFNKRGTSVEILRITLEALEAKLGQFTNQSGPSRTDIPVWFILADKNAPNDRLSKLMASLDEFRLPWRRAYFTDNTQWSIPDQLGSLLQAAGGLTHGIKLTDDISIPWTIGIDSSKRDAFSRVAASLISPDGQLSGAWISDQRRAEDINTVVLRKLLVKAAAAIPQSERVNGVLVIRDGRLFERENSDSYSRGLGGPVTLVELRKDNPPLLVGEGRLPPEIPCVAWLPDTPHISIGFLATLPRWGVGEFDSVLKLSFRKDWDHLKLGRDSIAKILVAQTLSPGLGLHDRYLPAPIYWADGIAGASNNDLRFRGQKVQHIN